MDDTNPTASAPTDFSQVTDLSAPPAGFEQVGGDLQGYWESASPETRQKEASYGSPPVLFTPLFATLSDSQIDAKKTSTLLHCRLEAPCKLRSAQKDEGYKDFPAGTLFGIWTKPGMKPLSTLSGAKVWMRNGVQVGKETIYFKDVDRPSPMVVFDIRAQGKGEKLSVREDRRKESLPERLRERLAKEAEDMDGIPF